MGDIQIVKWNHQIYDIELKPLVGIWSSNVPIVAGVTRIKPSVPWEMVRLSLCHSPHGLLGRNRFPEWETKPWTIEERGLTGVTHLVLAGHEKQYEHKNLFNELVYIPLSRFCASDIVVTY